MKKITGYLFFLMLAVFPLAAEELFVWQDELLPDGKLQIVLQIKDKCYIYAGSVQFDIISGGKKLAPEKAPHAVWDESSQMEIYPSGLWQWIFSGQAPYSGSVGYQGCSKIDGMEICLLPETWELNGTVPDKSASGTASDLGRLVRTLSGLTPVDGFVAFLQGENQKPDIPAASSFLKIALLAVLGGLALNLTPCVLPMIPVTLAVIGARGNGRKSGFYRGLAYGCGMALTYGILGIVVVFFGSGFGQLNSKWYFNLIIAVVFALLALAMAGVWQLDFSRFRKFSFSGFAAGKLAGAALTGALSALLAGACVAPVVISVLLYASSSYQNGNAGALLLPFLLGAGMALPWPFAGMGVQVLPRPGRFMVAVKYLFVLLIAGMALYYALLAWQLRPGTYSAQAELAKLESAAVQAQKEHKLLLVDIWATWCANCKEMEKSVLVQPEVKEALKNYVLVKFQAEQLDDPAIRTLLSSWGIPGLPGFVIIDPKLPRKAF